MKHEINARIRVLRPPAGVVMKVQRGRDALLAPYAQGPRSARFVYVNSGTYAGQPDTRWARRAKLSLVGVTTEQVKQLISTPAATLETSFNGTGSDGGPTCASVKGIEWRVASS